MKKKANIVIRIATLEDLPKLKSLGVELQEFERMLYTDRVQGESIVDRYNEILVREFITGNYYVFVAELGGRLIGYASGCPNNPEDDLINKSVAFHVDDLIVSLEYRGLGIGERMLQAMRDLAKALGFSVIELNVLAANTESQAFYRNQGFSDYELVLRKSL